MSLATAYARQAKQINRDAILSASPVKLLTMLYDRLLLDLRRAETAQQTSNWAVAGENLTHAQEIITELSTSLDRDKWDGAENLLGIYNYVSTALTTSHISRDPAVTREAIDLLEPLRQGWHDAAASLPAASEGGHGLG